MTDLRDSVLCVVASGRILGTAFVVEQDDPAAPLVALTCAHVIFSSGKQRGEALRLTLCALTRGEPTYPVTVDWNQVFDDEDLAVLPLPRVQALTPLLVARGSSCDGHDFNAFGFPSADSDDPAAMKGLRGYGQAIGMVGAGTRERIQFRGTDSVTGGFSGAPAFDFHTQRVMAMLTDIARVDAQLRGRSTAFGVPASVIRSRLRSLRTVRDRPYRGLDSFTEADGLYWIDPNGLKDELLLRLDSGALLAGVIGPSGVGKSSLLNAGLLPELRARDWVAEVVHVRLNRETVLAAVARWQQAAAGERSEALLQVFRAASTKPGDVGGAPAAATRQGMVLLLDQFEELLLIEEEPCRDIARALVALLDDIAHPGMRLIVALREHFLGLFGERAPELKRRVVDASVSVPLAIPLSKVRDIIALPAQRAGRAWDEPGFVAGVQQAVQDGYSAESASSVRCTALPLLQVFLAWQWDLREAAGAVADPVGPALKSAMGQLVDNVVKNIEERRASLIPEARARVEAQTVRVLVAFVAMGVDGDAGALKGRSLRQSEVQRKLIPVATAEEVQGIISALVNGRVLSARDLSASEAAPRADPLLELVHDAVLSGWSPLREPLALEREFLAWHGSLLKRAADPRSQLDRRELEAAQRWTARRAPDIDASVGDLVLRSEKSARLQRGAQSGAAGLIALLIGVTAYQGWQSAKASERTSRERLQRQLDERQRQLNEQLAARRGGVIARAQRTEFRARSLGDEALGLAEAIEAARGVEAFHDDELRDAVAAGLLRTTLAFQLRAPFDMESQQTIALMLASTGDLAVSLSLDSEQDQERFASWDIHTGRRLRVLAQRRACIPSVDRIAGSSWDCNRASYAISSNFGLFRHRAILMTNPEVLWVPDSPNEGVRRFRVRDGQEILPILAASSRVADIDRAHDSSAVAMGTLDGTVVVWERARNREVEYVHPGPVFRVATASGGNRLITLGAQANCLFTASVPTCTRLPWVGFLGATAITDSGDFAAVSSFAVDSMGGTVLPVLTVVDGNGRQGRFPTGLVDMAIEHGGSTNGVPTIDLHGVSLAPFSERYRAQVLWHGDRPARIDYQFVPPPAERETYQLARDGTWRFSLGVWGLPDDRCDEWRRTGIIRCAETMVMRNNQQWLRIFTGDLRAARHSVLFLDETHRWTLTLDNDDLVLRQLQAEGPAREIARVACPRGSVRSDATGQLSIGLDTVCAGQHGTLRYDATGAPSLSWRTWSTPVTAPAPRGGASVAAVDRHHAIVYTSRERYSAVDLSTGAERWSVTSPSSSFLSFRGDALVVWEQTPARRGAIYLSGHPSGTFTVSPAARAEVLETRGGLLIWPVDGNAVVDVRGQPVAFEPSPSPPTGIEGLSASPDGRWLVAVRSGAIPVIGEVAGPPVRVSSVTPLGSERVPLNANQSDQLPKTTWLRASSAETSFILSWHDHATRWRFEQSAWHASDVPEFRNGFIYTHAVIDPAGRRVGLVTRWSNRQGEGTPLPVRMIELRDARTLALLGVLPLPNQDRNGQPPVFLDADHLFIPETAEVVSLRPEDLRHTACELLRGRSEYQQVSSICDAPTTPIQVHP